MLFRYLKEHVRNALREDIGQVMAAA